MPRAERDLAEVFGHIHAAHSDTALDWYGRLKSAILTLEEHPNRCPAAPENNRLRHLLYGDKPDVYRVIFQISESRKEVEVLHVRRGARQRFKRRSLE